MTDAPPIDNAQETLEMQRTIAATPERVFKAWTEPEILQQWWAPQGSTIREASMDVRPGGRYRLALTSPQMGNFAVSGQYEVVRPHSDLSFTWRWERPDMDIGQSLVTISLSPVEQGTELLLTHALLPNAEARLAHREGWEGVFANLNAFVLGGGLQQWNADDAD